MTSVAGSDRSTSSGHLRHPAADVLVEVAAAEPDHLR